MKPIEKGRFADLINTVNRIAARVGGDRRQFRGRSPGPRGQHGVPDGDGEIDEFGPERFGSGFHWGDCLKPEAADLARVSCNA